MDYRPGILAIAVITAVMLLAGPGGLLGDPAYRFPAGRWETLAHHPPVPFGWGIEFNTTYRPQWIYFPGSRAGNTGNISVEADFFSNDSRESETVTFIELDDTLCAMDLYGSSGTLIGRLDVLYYDFGDRYLRYVTLSDGDIVLTFFESSRIW